MCAVGAACRCVRALCRVWVCIGSVAGFRVPPLPSLPLLAAQQPAAGAGAHTAGLKVRGWDQVVCAVCCVRVFSVCVPTLCAEKLRMVVCGNGVCFWVVPTEFHSCWTCAVLCHSVNLSLSLSLSLPLSLFLCLTVSLCPCLCCARNFCWFRDRNRQCVFSAAGGQGGRPAQDVFQGQARSTLLLFSFWLWLWLWWLL